MDPANCSQCRDIFLNDAFLQFKMQDILWNSSRSEALDFLNEHLAEDHAEHIKAATHAD